MNDKQEYLEETRMLRKTSAPLNEILNESGQKDYEEGFLSDYYSQTVAMDYMSIMKTSFILGCITFGGPRGRLETIETVLVKEKKFISNKHFTYVTNICLTLPGYNSSQVISVVTALQTKNTLIGLSAMIAFNLPSFIVILALAQIIKALNYEVHSNVRNFQPDTAYFDMSNAPFLNSIMVIAAGVCQAALGLLIQEAYLLSKKLSNSTFQLFLLGLAAVLYYFFNNYVFMVAVLLVCGLLSIFKGDQDYLLDNTEVKIDTSGMKFIGIPCIVVFIAVYFVISVIDFVYQNINVFLGESFLRLGALSFGEGQVIIPMILAEYTNKNLLEEAEVLNGYAIQSLLPGPMFSIAGYVGVSVSGILGGVISATMILLPGFLFIFAALPYVTLIKKSSSFQSFIRGLHSAAIGFVFTASFKLWIDSCFVNPYTNAVVGTLNVFFCYILSEVFKIHKPFIILFGALFMLLKSFADYYLDS